MNMLKIRVNSHPLFSLSITDHFVVENLESLLPKLLKKFTIFCVSIFV